MYCPQESIHQYPFYCIYIYDWRHCFCCYCCSLSNLGLKLLTVRELATLLESAIQLYYKLFPFLSKLFIFLHSAVVDIIVWHLICLVGRLQVVIQRHAQKMRRVLNSRSGSKSGSYLSIKSTIMRNNQWECVCDNRSIRGNTLQVIRSYHNCQYESKIITS